MKCHKAEKKLVAYLDRELSPPENIKLEKHLKSCSLCREALDSLSKVSDYFCLNEEIEPTSGFRNTVKQRILEQKRRSLSFTEAIRLSMKKPLPRIAALLLLIGLLITPSLVRKAAASTKVLINVEGMTSSCCDSIKAKLKEITGIKKIDVTPNSGTVCIILKKGEQVNLKRVERAICDAGPFSCKDIHIISYLKEKNQRR